MAEEAQVEEATLSQEFPNGRVRKIMRIDKDVNKVTSEALFLVARSTELFLRFLAAKSAEVASEKKRKIVKTEHLRAAVKRHQPTSDFLLDSLPMPTPQPQEETVSGAARPREVASKPLPAGTRRIDDFFDKSTSGASTSAGNQVMAWLPGWCPVSSQEVGVWFYYLDLDLLHILLGYPM
ncbi:Nuclear transcription factor Y subunit C-4 [Linum grandiflorum]